ncbi:MAG: TrmH family RNA methyltransferase [Planctomycetota bacterium]
MDAEAVIRSRGNPIIKRIGAVRAGLEPATIVLEGDRLVDDARRVGLALECILLAEDRLERAGELERSGAHVRLVDRELMAKVSVLKSPPGVLALCATPASIDVASLSLDTHTLLLVVAGVADPGNLGALARSAEAFGAHALLVARGGASPWNDKALRGSMGSLLRIPVHFGSDAVALARELASRNVRQACAATRGGKSPRDFDWRGPLALWVSAETGAMPASTRSFEPVTIEMAGQVESLNVAVATSILLFASGRAASHEAEHDG